LQLAAILTVIVVMFGSGSFFLHSYQVERNAYVFKRDSEVLEERAKEAIKKKDSKAAALAYRNAIKDLGWYTRLVPNDVDAMERLGLMLADMAKEPAANVRAYGVLEQVLRLDPERTKVRRRLIPVAIRIHRFQDAKIHLEQLMNESPQDAELYDLMGQCHFRKGEFESATNNFKKAIDLDPTRMESYVWLGNVVGTYQGHPQEARQWYDKMVQRNPKNWQAQLERGIYLASVAAGEEALSAALKTLELQPDESGALLLASRCYLAKRDFATSRRYAARGVELYPDLAGMYINMAEVEGAAKHADKAIAVVRQGLATTGENPQLLWALANRLIDANQLAEAKTTINQLRQRHYESSQAEDDRYKPLVEYLDARIEMAQGHWLDASKGFERSRRNVLTPERVDLRKLADMSIGVCYGRMGSADQQIEAFRRALKNDPGLSTARLGLAEALLSTGNLDEALREFQSLEKQGKLNAAGLISLARLLIYRVARQPAGQQDWSAIEKLLGAVEKAAPDLPALPLVRGQLLLAQKRPADATSLWQKAVEKSPQRADLWEALINLAGSQQDWTRTERLLERSRKELGDTAEQRLLEAQYLVQHPDSKLLDRLRKLAENVDRFTKPQRAQLWTGLAGAATLANNLPYAKELLLRVAEENPNNVQVRYQLMEQAMRERNNAALEQSLTELKKVVGEDAYWHYGQARRISSSVDEKKLSKAEAEPLLAEALAHLAKARELRPSWPRIVALTGVVNGQMGKVDSALNNYLEAIELGERNPQVIQRAIQLLYAKQKYDEAHKLLGQFEQQQANLSPDMNRLTASVALQEKEFDRAVEAARKAAASSKSYEDHLWLGQVLGVVARQTKTDGQSKKAGELTAEAEKAFRRAVELEPKVAMTWVGLIQFLSASGAKEQAQQALQEAAQKIPAKQAPLALAQCCEAMQDVNAAQKKYEAALGAAPDDPLIVRAVADFYFRTRKPKQAEEQFARIIEHKVKCSESEVLWARRQLALLIADRGGYQNYQKARELMDQNLASPEVSLWDRRVSAVIDARDPLQAHRKEALAKYEQIVQDQSATPEDRYQLARMYLEAGKWIEASNQFRSLVASQGTEPRYLIAYIDALLDHGETNNAETQLERLQKLSPNLIDTSALQARMWVIKNEPDKALALLKEFIDRPNVQPADRSVRLRAVAAFLDHLSRQMTKPAEKPIAERFSRQAETFYRAYLEKNPGHELELVSFLTRQGRTDDALDLFDRIWDKSHPVVVNQVAELMIAYSMSADQMQRLARILQAAIQRFERPSALLMTAADLCFRRGLCREAEELYREVLQKSKGNASTASAMNNLAVLLAQQGIKLDEALKLVNQAIDIYGPAGAVLDTRASVYLALGDVEKALADINRALAEDESPIWLFHQAQAYDRAGQHDKAATAMERALHSSKKPLTKNLLYPPELASFDRLSRLVAPSTPPAGRR
jgi:tetratricopeptide (TPR) repeat protein